MEFSLSVIRDWYNIWCFWSLPLVSRNIMSWTKTTVPYRPLYLSQLFLTMKTTSNGSALLKAIWIKICGCTNKFSAGPVRVHQWNKEPNLISCRHQQEYKWYMGQNMCQLPPSYTYMWCWNTSMRRKSFHQHITKYVWLFLHHGS